MGRRHRIRVTKEELERYERSLPKPKGRETPLASTAQGLEYLAPLTQPRRIRAPSSERRRPMATRPMTPRTAARRGRLVSSKGPSSATDTGARGYLCEVPSSARGRRIVARRRAAASRELPAFDDSRRKAEQTFGSTVRRRSAGSGDRSRTPLWAHAQRPASAVHAQRPASAAASVPGAIPWDRATLPPAPSTCSLRPQRSLIDEADREARLVLRDSFEAVSRQKLLAKMASDPRPFTAPVARTRRSHESPIRSPRNSPRSDSSATHPEQETVQAEDVSVQTPAAMLGHNAEHGAFMLEIVCAEGIDAFGLQNNELGLEGMQSHCRVTLEGSTWLTPVALGYRPEWHHLETTFVTDTESCLVLDVLSSRDDTTDLVNNAKIHYHVAIRVSSFPTGSSERWYPLLPYTGECIPVGDVDGEPAEGVARVLLRTQFSPRAADTEEDVPALHKQLHAHHSALMAAAEQAAGQLSVKVLGGRNLGSNSSAASGSSTMVPQDSFVVVEYDGTTARPGPVIFGASQPQWGMSAGPFSVAPANSENDNGAPLIVRVHKWRSLQHPSACSAAYELLGVASIDVRHAIHKWSHASTQQQRNVVVVEAWVSLHSWGSPDVADVVDSSHHPSDWHNPHRRLDPSGEALIQLTFEKSSFVRVERPLPYHTTLQVKLCQCHRLMGDRQSSVRIELSMHRSAHLATRKPPFPETCETWSTRIVDEMFSPTFYETFSFSLQCATSCLRLDVYEISQVKPADRSTSIVNASPRPHAPSLASARSNVDSADCTDASGLAERTNQSRNTRQKLLCSAVIPFMKLLSTTAPHWYNLLPEEDTMHSMHSRNVDKWLEVKNLQKTKHHDSLKLQLPHGAVQFEAKMISGHASAHKNEGGEIRSDHIHQYRSPKRHHARVTITGVSVNGLPKVQATGRTGYSTNKLIEPSPMVRFSFGQNSRQTVAHRRTHETSWNDTLHLPFSWLDDGDGDPEPEELEAEMKLHGGLTCKVYHRASPNATVRDQLIGSTTLSLIELVSRGGHGVSKCPGPRTYTIFNTTGHGVRQLRATGCITLGVTVEFEGKDQLKPGERWVENDDEEDDDAGLRGDHHITQPHTQLHYMLRTAESMRSLPIVMLEPELLAVQQSTILNQAEGAAEFPFTDNDMALTSLQLTVHSMRHIPLSRPICRVYIASGGVPSSTGPHGSVKSDFRSSSLHVPAAFTPSGEDSCFLLGLESLEQNVTFNLPHLMPEAETDLVPANHFELAGQDSQEPPEDRVLVIEILENIGALESEVVLGALYGRVSLPVAQAAEIHEQGQNWHSVAVARGTTFADQQIQEEQKKEQQLTEIPALQLSLTVKTVSGRIAPHVISAAIRLPLPKSDFADPDDEAEVTFDEEEDDDSAARSPLGNNSLYHGARKNVRIFYDTTNLDSLDDINEIEDILLDAKEIWSQHHHFEYEVEDLKPIIMEVFGKLKRDDLNEEWEVKATENVLEWVHLYRHGILTHWTFKHFCAFWRQVVEDTVTYAIRLGEAFRDFYCRSVAFEQFGQLDINSSGDLEGNERNAMISWILGLFYGENPSAIVQREIAAEVRHFQMRLDADGNTRITFDEIHQYIFDHIKWMKGLQERQALALEAAKQRAIGVLQSAARGWLQRRALRDLLMRSIPEDCQESMLFIDHIPLADAQPYKIRSYALQYWGATRAVAVRSKDDVSTALGSQEGTARCWAILWLESKDKAALALDTQEEAIAANQQHFEATNPGSRQFHIERCDLHKLHSKKAIGILAEIWREVPMAVVSGIPQSFAEESKLRDILAQCGAVDAIVLEKMERDESWALVTFRHARSILKATSTPIEAGVNILLLHRATFQQVVKMNNATVQKQRGWSDSGGEAGGLKSGSGLAGTMSRVKDSGGRAPAAKETRETAEEVASRLSRSFKTNPGNVERIIDRQTDVPRSKAHAKQTSDKTSGNSFAEYYDSSNTLRTGGRADALYKVVWQGRFVSPSWVTRDFLLQSPVTMGLVYEYEDDLAQNKQAELELRDR